MPRGELAKRIGVSARTARLRAKLTQANVAELIGVASEVYGRMERGAVRPSVETLRKMSLALGIATDELLGLIESGSSAQRPVADEEPPELRHLIRRIRALDLSCRRLIAVLTHVLGNEGRG